jgi:hypothetical protein
MDATEYIKILLDISVALVITVVLFVLARRARKEKTFVGFKKSSHDEKYAGYAMLAIGIAIIAVSIYELVVLLDGGSFSRDIPFGLPDISATAGNQTTAIVSAQDLGLAFSVSFWLTIFGYGGRKFVSLGLDLLRGRKVTLRRNL